MSMEQVEHFHFVSKAPLLTQKRSRLHANKMTTAGTAIGPCPLPDLRSDSATWRITFKQKKELYGEFGRILPGGRADQDADLKGSDSKREKLVRTDKDIEPVTYHGLHREVIEELVHQIGGRNVKCIIDLTATEPTLALVAMEWRIPYLGVTFNSAHQELIKARLAQLVFQQFRNAKSSMHVPKLVELLLGTQSVAGMAEAVPLGDAPEQPSSEQRVPKASNPVPDKEKKAASVSALRAALVSKLTTESAEAEVNDE